jgi:hypothetical protein
MRSLSAPASGASGGPGQKAGRLFGGFGRQSDRHSRSRHDDLAGHRLDVKGSLVRLQGHAPISHEPEFLPIDQWLAR